MIGFENFVEYYLDLPLLVKAVWFLSFTLIVFIIFFIAYLHYLRGYLRKKEAVSKKIFLEYQSDLVNYLYSEAEAENQNNLIKKIKNSISNSFKRKICISVLSKLKNDISGEMADAINNLYIKTGLIDYSKSKLQNKKWHVIASGIKELNLFEITNVFEQVKKHENHVNSEVRNEVQLYYVSLFQFKGLEFLNKLTTPISEWNQIQLLEILQKFDDQQIQDITPWLKSKNDSVVLFSLKLAKIYNQFQVINTLLELLNHPNKNIRIQTIKILDYFQVKEAKSILKSDFSNRDDDEKVAFFNMLKSVVENSDEDFIVENSNSPIFQIKVLALELLKIINSDKLSVLKTQALTIEDQIIFNYLENK